MINSFGNCLDFLVDHILRELMQYLNAIHKFHSDFCRIKPHNLIYIFEPTDTIKECYTSTLTFTMATVLRRPSTRQTES